MTPRRWGGGRGGVPVPHPEGWPMDRPRLVPAHDPVRDRADALDLDLDGVTRAQVARRGTGETDALRCPRGDDVTGIQGHDLADVGQDLPDGKDHVGGAPVL